MNLSSCLFPESVCHTTPSSITGCFYQHTKQEQITLEESPGGRSVSNVVKGYVTRSTVFCLSNYITEKNGVKYQWPSILTCTNFSQYISTKVFIKSALPENTCLRVDLIQAIQTTDCLSCFQDYNYYRNSWSLLHCHR